jgi:hypothetical protein
MDRQRRTEIFLQAAHRFAMTRLRADPTRITEVRTLLHRWREQSGRTRSDPYWDEWERLLALPLDDLERAICGDDEHATVLRSVSPIGALITTTERRELLREARRS